MNKKDFFKVLHRARTHKVKFPKIFRTITEKDHLAKVLIGLCALLIALFSFRLAQKIEDFILVSQQRAALIAQMNLWGGIAAKYPTYRDAYFQAALAAYRLKDWEKEQYFLQKVLQIDPNFKQAVSLQKISTIEQLRQKGE